MASRAAGTTPIRVRIKLMIISEITISYGRSGLTNRLARLRDQTSSRKETETPSWPRNNTSHKITAASSTPKACATQVELVMRNWLMNPHRIICRVGQ